MNCARCLETGKETPATFHVKATAYFHPIFQKWIDCQNDGAKVCKACLAQALATPGVKLSASKLLATN